MATSRPRAADPIRQALSLGQVAMRLGASFGSMLGGLLLLGCSVCWEKGITPGWSPVPSHGCVIWMFPKMVVPQNPEVSICFNTQLVYFWMVWGYPYGAIFLDHPAGWAGLAAGGDCWWPMLLDWDFWMGWWMLGGFSNKKLNRSVDHGDERTLP